MADQLSVADPNCSDKESTLLIPFDTPGVEAWAKRRHLLDTADLTVPEIECLMALAVKCKKLHETTRAPLSVLNNKIVANLFYENSTRTRSSFELAAKKLGASVLNLDIKTSSVTKGETIEDTAMTLVSMGVNAVIQRHSSSGAAHKLSKALTPEVHVINAGDGWNAHPTQALLDLFSMLEIRPSVTGCKIAIIGDITHSRVARSNISLLKKLGVDIHVAGPPTLVPKYLDTLGATVHSRLEPAIENADFIIALRLQMERQQQGLIPSIGEFQRLYRIDHKRLSLAKPGVHVLHPGPVNRGIEITDELMDDPNVSLISRQVASGIAVRMAVLFLLMSEHNQSKQRTANGG
ncbi:MAG: aspartate carbamoyltransferase catalytic subunit [Candidatus Obscuribacterales bacterium]|nr:aspartate carbamoyltransferase catalytic subunit [Cyanobacteria bacterium SZAS LIN-5]RTL40177.1 MAG: aspartate carbamoyltransferase catalytic subunit [Candidatus Melainabacteria bacterium]